MLWLPHTTRTVIPDLDHGPRPHTKGVVIHTTEGDSLPTEFFRHNGGVGAHAAYNDTTAVEYVALDRKAWHAVEANGEFIGFEHVAHAAWTRNEWKRHTHMLQLSADRVAWIHHEFALGRPKMGVSVRSHASGGAAWGGHHDPGPGFPWDIYMRRVQNAYNAHWAR